MLDVPRLVFAMSYTLSLWARSGVARVTENTRVPASVPLNVVSGGSVARRSLLEKWTVPTYPVATLPKRSFNVTVTLNGLRAVAVLGAVKNMFEAAAGRTVTLRVPVIVAVAVSVAVIVCAPALMSFAENVPWPLVSVASAGRTTPAEESVLVKWIVPA